MIILVKCIYVEEFKISFLYTIFMIGFFVSCLAILFYAFKVFKGRKNKDDGYKKSKKRLLTSIVILVVTFVGASTTVPDDSQSSADEATSSSSHKKSSESKKTSSSKKSSSSSSAKKESSSSESESDDENLDDQSSYQQVSYDNIARNSNDWSGKLVTFSGTVTQVNEEKGDYLLLVSMDDDADQLTMVYVPKSTMPDGDILEDDAVTVYGRSEGMTKYETVMGDENRVPSIYETTKLVDQGR